MLCILSNDKNEIFPSFLGERFDAVTKRDVENSYYRDVLSQRPESELVASKLFMDIVKEIIFDGSIFVITGVVEGYERPALVEAIETRGGKVMGSVSKKTNYVIVGMQDVSVISDKENAKSSKILRAEELQADGHSAKIIDSSLVINALL